MNTDIDTSKYKQGESSMYSIHFLSHPTAYEGRYCGADTDDCSILTCYEGVDCEDNPAPLEGVTCGPCPRGYSGDGMDCFG